MILTTAQAGAIGRLALRIEFRSMTIERAFAGGIIVVQGARRWMIDLQGRTTELR